MASIINYFIVTNSILLLIISLPLNYFITGSWGYKFKAIDWYTDWASKCGF